MESPRPQNLLRGIICALIATIFMSFLNVCSKILVENLDPIVVGFWRNLVAFSFLFVGLIVLKKRHLMVTTKLKSQIWRAVIGTFGLTMAIWTFQYLPVTEGVVISFTSPFLVILLSYPLLGERVGIYRIAATMMGLVGVLIILGFDAQSLNTTGVLVAFGWAFANGIVIIMLRQLGRTEHAVTTTFYFLLIGLVLTSFYLPFTDQILPDAPYWFATLGIGVAGLLSLILKTESFRHGNASVIAPLAYTILIWSAIMDFLIWDHFASLNVWIGAIVIVGSNLIILWREQTLLARKKNVTYT